METSGKKEKKVNKSMSEFLTLEIIGCLLEFFIHNQIVPCIQTRDARAHMYT
jgi:hypothetical protein